MKYSQIDEASINDLMEIFYKKVREDKNGLGDIFNSKIGTTEEKWTAHKAKIANFWYGMMLGKGNYSGNPMKAHIDLPPFPQNMFEIWLGLFRESVDAIYEKEAADIFHNRAFMISQSFQNVLYSR